MQRTCSEGPDPLSFLLDCPRVCSSGPFLGSFSGSVWAPSRGSRATKVDCLLHKLHFYVANLPWDCSFVSNFSPAGKSFGFWAIIEQDRKYRYFVRHQIIISENIPIINRPILWSYETLSLECWELNISFPGVFPAKWAWGTPQNPEPRAHAPFSTPSST